MKIFSRLLVICLTLTGAEACSKAAAPTAPTPAPVVTAPPTPPVLTLEPDTDSPVGESVAITYGSFGQEPGKISIAITGFNLRNQIGVEPIISPTGFGVSGARGQVRVDDALLEFDGYAFGDFVGGAVQGVICPPILPESPGIYPFCVARKDDKQVTGSGELFLLRFKPRPGITAGATRIELVPHKAHQQNYTTPLQLLPFFPSGTNKIQNSYGGTITIRPGV
jgi:hypothetical protein